ncbi:flavodoxin [Phascolarctobacterium succinatutens]|uniref:flavodoxin n=1 Tax=Phascolarctobacterium succinatutens TaxID=626940 RepID=UPI002639CAE7|nr:flavodoxin [uncultured Phascolarctobacterium sp.]
MNRRDFLKLAGVSLLSLAALTMGCGSFNAAKADAPAPKVKQSTSEGASQNMNNGKKILVAYFSWSGNTKAVAEEIHKQVGGDIVEIVPATPYSETYSVTVAKAKAEQEAGARPAISTKIADFEQYDTIYLGYPNWWGSMPMPVATFIDTYKMSGKKVAPFFTHGGGGVQRCMSDLEARAQGAKFTDYLCLSGSSAKNSQGEITSWVKKTQN